MAERILITGGSGLIGNYLAGILHTAGYEIGMLSRKRNSNSNSVFWNWDPDIGIIDNEAIVHSDHIIHLAGANLSEKKWNSARKIEILNSRKKSTELLFKSLSETEHHVRTFISASAIGYYGWDTGSILVDEQRNKPGDDFLSTVVKEWESSVSKMNSLLIRTVIFRFGLVLSNQGGVLTKMILPAKFGLGAAFGSGEQYLSWIHIEDLSRLILMAIENESFRGIYNAVSPEPVTNKEFTRSLNQYLGRPSWIPNIPAFILRLFIGEMASLVLGGNRVSSAKIESMGFKFNYRNIKEAFKNLIA